MAEEWINKAFEKAGRKCDNIKRKGLAIRKFLDENHENILDNWKGMVGEDKALMVANALFADEDLSMAIESMCETYFVAGLLFHKHYMKK